MKFTARERLLASTIFCGGLLAAAPAFAQDAAPPPTDDTVAVQEIVVTGSRIPQPNLASVSPVQVVGSEEIQLGGRPNTVDFLNQLPQISQNSQTGFSSTSNPLSGPGGVATIDLRGLGQVRTLVLVDGRRLGIGDPNTGNPNPSPDINQIPSQLVERVEVLTGGASATYGSDAVAGVVNFVMRRDFEGLQIDAQASVFQHEQHNEFIQGIQRASNVPVAMAPDDNWDGKAEDISIVFGTNSEDGRGNVTAYFTFHDQDPVLQNARDYSACQFNVDPNPRCAGSSNSNIFYTSDGSSDSFAVLGNEFVPFGTPGTTPPDRFNSNEYSYLLQQSTRYAGGFFARYDINEHFNVYSDFMMMNDRTNVQIAPSALFQGSGASPLGGFLINCDNPFLSDQQVATFCTEDFVQPGATPAGDVDLTIGRRNIEGGGRNSFYEHQNYRVVVGSRGEIFGPFSYDLYGSYYYTNLYTVSQNYLSIARLQNALQVVEDEDGNITCVSGGSCVPYNIFQDGGVTPEALAYLDTSGSARGEITQRIVEGTITGELTDYGIVSPWSEDGVGIAVGFQNRRENLQFAPDQAQLSGDLSGAGGASVAVDNSIDVIEAYGEVRVPLVQNAPFADEILVEAGYRFSDYSTGIETETWKAGLQWAPTEDIRFRASYQQAIRAPNILELFTPFSVTNTSQVSVDPCAGTAANPATATLEQCQRTGVTAAQYGNGGSTNNIVQCPSGQCAVLTGGNPDLNAEEAKTFSVGFTFTPTFIDGLVASVDYYNIDLKDTIGAVPLEIVLNKCLEEGALCDLVVRAPNGTLFGTSRAQGGYINGSTVNIGAGTASGIDFQASYALPLETWNLDSIGEISFNFVGSYMLENTTVPLPGDPEYDCAGLYGPSCQTLNPEWRHTLRVNYTTPYDVTFSAAWRYIDSMTFEGNSDEETIGGDPVDYNAELPQRSYIDLSAVWNVNDTFTLRAGVNNVLDQDPPLVNSLITGTGLPNTYPTYDLLGRKLFVGVTANF